MILAFNTYICGCAQVALVITLDAFTADEAIPFAIEASWAISLAPFCSGQVLAVLAFSAHCGLSGSQQSRSYLNMSTICIRQDSDLQYGASVRG